MKFAKLGRMSRGRVGLGLALGYLCLGLFACRSAPPSSGSPSGIPPAYAHRPQLQGKAVVELEVQTAEGVGKVLLEIRGEEAPLTAGQFVDLVQRGFYNGLTFHRVEKDPQPFVVQGGDPRGDGTGGAPEPGSSRLRTIPLEIQVRGEPHPRYNTLIEDPIALSKLALPHRLGAVAMARSSPLDSASSQFYIALSALPILDGRYAVFGYVTSGMEWVERLQVGDVIRSARVPEGADLLRYPAGADQTAAPGGL
ncbi:peptidylprolyl isomerase [Synechococcus sp. H55.10]|uniref:peptidylprolyl isomerase n=1 Tax=Synechococcus sp. H55.10 TaxID=2964503 RepID=UPI0039C6D804